MKNPFVAVDVRRNNELVAQTQAKIGRDSKSAFEIPRESERIKRRERKRIAVKLVRNY